MELKYSEKLRSIKPEEKDPDFWKKVSLYQEDLYRDPSPGDMNKIITAKLKKSRIPTMPIILSDVIKNNPSCINDMYILKKISYDIFGEQPFLQTNLSDDISLPFTYSLKWFKDNGFVIIWSDQTDKIVFYSDELKTLISTQVITKLASTAGHDPDWMNTNMKPNGGDYEEISLKNKLYNSEVLPFFEDPGEYDYVFVLDILESATVINHHNIDDDKPYQKIHKLIDDFMETVVVVNDYKDEERTAKMIVESNTGGLTTVNYKVKETDIAHNAELYYGEGFQKINESIIRGLNSDDSGIVLLHGDSGTGKTYYIRYLTATIDKPVVSVSPEFISMLSRRDFMTFVVNNLIGHVIVVEDAEKILKSRDDDDSNNNDSVHNILKITDGMESDVLGIKLICSFNTKIENIDHAITRPSRLIKKHEFKRLSPERAKEICQVKGLKEPSGKSDYSLAELFEKEY